MNSYRNINYNVMLDTQRQYETVPELVSAVENLISHQYMVAQEDVVEVAPVEKSNTRYVVSGKRSFEAAKGYSGKKVAVLNFANNHSIGGAPFSAGAQEESLCRCSTLLPCLQAMKENFYERHIRLYTAGELDHMGNDDIIYTPDVIVFKTDERTDPIWPQMMHREEWYKVDVITCAAPELWYGHKKPDDYEVQIARRIKRILDVAAKAGAEVLILGKWGCGAFKNSIDVVARTFKTLLKNYNFEIVEFALATRSDLTNDVFAQAIKDPISTSSPENTTSCIDP